MLMLHAGMLMLHAEGGMLMLHASMLMLHAEGGMLMLHAGMLMLHAEGGMFMCHAVPSLSLFPPRNDAQQARKKRPMNLHPEEQLTEPVCRQPWMTVPRSHSERTSGDHATRARRFAWRTPPQLADAPAASPSTASAKLEHIRYDADAATAASRETADALRSRGCQPLLASHARMSPPCARSHIELPSLPRRRQPKTTAARAAEEE